MVKGFKKIWESFSRHEQVLFAIAFLFALISGTILFVTFLQKSTTIVPASGGEYSEGLVGQPVYVNPVIASTETDRDAVKLIFSNLPDIADKIEASTDGRTWKVRLKENLFWQDKEKLTSDDVIFTVEKIQDPDTQSPLFASWQGVVASRLSELELQFILVNPYPFFMDNLKDLYIAPKHLFAAVPSANWKLSEYNLKPIGNGPYIFASYNKRQDGFITSYQFRADPHYFGKHALIQVIDFNFFSTTDDLIKDFNTGKIDGVANVSPGDIPDIKRPFEIFSFRLPSYYALFMNQSKNLALQDVSVRHALSDAIDRAELVKKILNGRGTEEFGPVPHDAPYFADVSPIASSTPDAMLDTAGWKKTADGSRQKIVGKSVIHLQITITVPRVNFLIATANSVKDAWQNLGVKVNLSVMTPDEISAGPIKNRDYEILLFGNVLAPSSDLYSFWHSSERFYPGMNLSLYNNKKADTLIESIRQNLNQDSRTDQFASLEKTIASDYPAIFLYSPDFLYVTAKNLQGLNPGPIGEPANRFDQISSWYIKTARSFK